MSATGSVESAGVLPTIARRFASSVAIAERSKDAPAPTPLERIDVSIVGASSMPSAARTSSMS
jgi:hypothetical protein